MKDKSHISISVIMPCYNNGKYVKKAIESVLAQTIDDWELVIVNDGSTDDSDKIIRAFQEKEPRIHQIYQDNSGVGKARNQGAKAAQGELILFCDADDYLSPTCLEKAIQAFKDHPEINMFYLKNEIVDEISKKKFPIRGYCGSFQIVLLYGTDVKIVIRKKEFLEVSGFDENMKTGCEDWEFCIRFLHTFPRVLESTDILYYYRYHDNGQRLTKKAGKEIEKIHSYIYSKNMNIYVEHFGSPIASHQWAFAHSWADRRLPKVCKKLLDVRASIYQLLKWK